MVSLAIVAAFLVLMVAVRLGAHRERLVARGRRQLRAADVPRRRREVGAPAGAQAAPRSAAPPARDYKSTVVDPIGDVIARAQGREAAPRRAARRPPPTAKSVDPLADVMADIRDGQGSAAAAAAPPKRARRRCRSAATSGAATCCRRRSRARRRRSSSGLAAALVATFIGTVLGALAGYYGRWVDDVLNWFYSVFSSIPYLLLILAVAAVLQQKGTLTIILILGLTGWTGVFRLIRAEYLKHKGREYVQAADAIGASNARRMFVHIFPNVSHVVLVQLSILVVAFIKAEVILSFLGFGVPVDVVSWGSMLNEAQNELILGKWWQLVAAGDRDGGAGDRVLACSPMRCATRSIRS